MFSSHFQDMLLAAGEAALVAFAFSLSHRALDTAISTTSTIVWRSNGKTDQHISKITTNKLRGPVIFDGRPWAEKHGSYFGLLPNQLRNSRFSFPLFVGRKVHSTDDTRSS